MTEFGWPPAQAEDAFHILEKEWEQEPLSRNGNRIAPACPRRPAARPHRRPVGQARAGKSTLQECFACASAAAQLQASAALDEGLADLAAGRGQTLDDYTRERGL